MRRTGNHSYADESFNRFDVEAWIIGKLGNPQSLTEGLTTFAIRKERIREILIQRELVNECMTAKSAETWSSVFERFYGEPLITSHGKRG